jgi:Ca2+-binding RTX toxin-like protein
LVFDMIVGTAGVPQDLAQSRDYDAIFSALEAAGVSVYAPNTQYQENPVALSLGLESDFLPPPFGTADPSVYEAMRAHGIKLVITADQLYDANLPMPSAEDDPLLALIDAAGADLIYGIYGYDEPAHTGVSVAASQALYEHIKSIDPALQVLQVHRNLDEENSAHLTPEGMEAYLDLVAAHAQWADIVGFDVYPIGLSRGSVTPYSNGLMVSPEQAVQDYMTWLQTELPQKQHVMVLQAFNVLDLYSDEMLATLDPEVVAALTPPTAQELADMLLAAEGADAVFWWGQSHITDSTISQLWQNVLAETAAYLADFPDSDIIGTTGADVLNGTEIAERISGDDGDDALHGGDGDDILVGGTGADTMQGDGGNDTYYVDNAGDVVDEGDGTGLDIIRTNLASFSLQSANVLGSVENLIGTSGLGQILTGNSLANTITGSWGNDRLEGGGGSDILRGGKGNDIYVVNEPGVTVDETDASGTDTVWTSMAVFSLATAGILGDVENLTGTSESGQTLTGNTLDNVITGGSGNDTLEGGGGNDTLRGSAGNDIYIVTDVELVDETGGAGEDEVRTALSGFDLKGPHVLGDIENLTGTALVNQILIGNALNNKITAGAGDDTLDGDAGQDTLAGGAGGDLYFVDQSNDIVIELEGAGVDNVFSTATYMLADHVENLKLQGEAAINGTGNGLDNSIQGNNAANVINGGAGADSMSGGGGADTYWVDNSGDFVFEELSEGSAIDTINSTLDWMLGDYIENLTLIGPNALSGVGNSLSNTITGNEFANTLDGGAGADTLQGGAGNDIYLVDDTADQIVELSGGGTDLVLSSATSYTLSANIESARILSTGAADLTGNNLGNTLYAGEGNNALRGGTGSDTVSYINALGGVTVRLDLNVFQATGGSGSDFLANIENLTGSYLNDKLTGNSAVNRIDGSGGDDTINGGLGNDILTGGAGNDTFVFNSTLGSTNVDTIRSFRTPGDTIALENNGIFTALTTEGILAAGAFNTGSAAKQADDRIIFNTQTGALLYDADGKGGVAAVQFAVLTDLVGVLKYTDFMII